MSYHFIATGDSFNGCFSEMALALLMQPLTETEHWQAQRGVPQTKTYELLNTVIEIHIPATPGAWGSYMEPNVAWAEEHFKERVSGMPVNPPPSHERWPYAQKGNDEHTDASGKFSHSYPERLWARRAMMENGEPEFENMGIRYRYGDLDDAVTLLRKTPRTRQCFIPIWFPEDLAAAAEEEVRVPCTLGYHLILREEKLHCFYPMRSLDVLRYLRDDAYMAGRLVQWMIEECKANTMKDKRGYNMWDYITPGTLTMHATSVHCFEGDLQIMKHQYGIERKAT